MDSSFLATHLTSVFAHTGSLPNPYAALQPTTTLWPAPVRQQPVPLRKPRPCYGRFSPTYLTICREAAKGPRAQMPIGSEVAAVRRRAAQEAQISSAAVVAKPVLQPGQMKHYSSKDINDVLVGQPRCFFLPPVANERIAPSSATQSTARILPTETMHNSMAVMHSTRNVEVRRHTHPEVTVKGTQLEPLRYVGQ